MNILAADDNDGGEDAADDDSDNNDDDCEYNCHPRIDSLVGGLGLSVETMKKPGDLPRLLANIKCSSMFTPQ